MISTDAFDGEGALVSKKNKFIQDLRNAVFEYNGLPSVDKFGNLSRHSLALDKILRCAGYYLTSKPPQPDKKSYGRFGAILSIAEQMGEECKRLGLVQLSCWSNMSTHFLNDYEAIGNLREREKPEFFDASVEGKYTSKYYWLEMLDPMHRHGRDLSKQWIIWATDSKLAAAKTSFWDYMKTNMHPSLAEVEVQYFPERQQYNKSQYMVSFVGGNLKDFQMNNFSTSSNETAFNGRGWVIFVCSPELRIYAGSHVVGEQHHSSFIGGQAVAGAGEMVVDDGKIRAITCKSGHYKPDVNLMLSFISRFPEIPGDAVIRPDFSSTNYYYCTQLRMKGLNAKPLSVDDVKKNIPAFANDNSLFDK